MTKLEQQAADRGRTLRQLLDILNSERRCTRVRGDHFGCDLKNIKLIPLRAAYSSRLVPKPFRNPELCPLWPHIIPFSASLTVKSPSVNV